jgi:hypothetical protein
LNRNNANTCINPNFKGAEHCCLEQPGLAGPLQLSKTLAILIASCSCPRGLAGHHKLQRNVCIEIKAVPALPFKFVQLEVAAWGLAGPLKFSKTMAVLIGSAAVPKG